MRPGRRDPEEIAPGDRIDWWEVEAFQPGRRLRLFSQMKVPGAAWLEFEVEPETGGSLIRQTARFQPRGVLGRVYWYALLPVHVLVFSGLVRSLGKAAEVVAASGLEQGQEEGWTGPTEGEFRSASD